MLQKIFATGLALCCLNSAFSQSTTPQPDTTAPKSVLTISGGSDAYYRYDLGENVSNNKTSFTNSHNSFELGMVSVKIDQTFGKAGITADLGFGKRAEEFSYADDRTRLAIKQLYLSYTLKNDIKLTAGSWATHCGYELVDAFANRNYSMSYMFSYGPFLHTGIKAEKTFGKIGAMLGFANPTDLKSASFSHKYVIGQISATSGNEKGKAYLNFHAGKPSDSVRVSQLDLVATYTMSAKFNIGVNGTIFNVQQKAAEANFGAANPWWGLAGYFNADPYAWLGLTLRSEYFSDQNQLNVFGSALSGGSVLANTFSISFKKDNLTLMPEVRFEKATEDIFLKSSGLGTDTSVSLLLAAMYKF
jgi:hypothetical protein